MLLPDEDWLSLALSDRLLQLAIRAMAQAATVYGVKIDFCMGSPFILGLVTPPQIRGTFANWRCCTPDCAVPPATMHAEHLFS